MLARAALLVSVLATLLAAPVPSARAAGCAGSPSCPYREVQVLGKDPPSGRGVFRFPQAIAFTPGGSYVFVADQHSSVVQKFDRQGTWQSEIGGYAEGGQLGRLGVIGGLATDRSGHLYVLDSENDRVQVFRSDTGAWIGAWGSRGSGAGTFRLGANTGAGGLAVDHRAPAEPPVAYVADQVNHRIQKFTLAHATAADAPHPVLPAGARSATERDYVPVATPDTMWGTFGDCTATGCSGSAAHYLLNYPQGVAVNPRTDEAGRVLVYVADDDNHRVVQYTSDGAYLRQVGSFGTGPGQFRFPYDVGVDARNYLYVADNNNHRVQKFGGFDLGFLGLWGGFGNQAGGLEFPRALAALADDPLGGVYVADTANNRVQGFDENGAQTAAWGIAGRGAGYVTRPGGIAVDGSGAVYVADTWNHRIEKLAADGSFLGQWGYISSRSGYAAPAPGDGQFQFPYGIAHDPRTGNLWVADTGNNRVQAFSASGAWLVTQGGTGPGIGAGQFNGPRGLAVDGAGNLYVADTGNHRVQRRDAASGAWSAVPLGELNEPVAVATGSAGELYVADAGGVLSSVRGDVMRVSEPSGGFDRPGGLWLDGTRLYVSDTGNGRLMRLDLGGGTWETLGGEGLELGSFVQPAGVVVAPSSDVYVADQYNNRVQKLVLSAPPAAPTPRAAQLDRRAPRLRLRLGSARRLLRDRVLIVLVRCDEPCAANGSGTVRILSRRAKSASRRVIKLRRARRNLSAGVTSRLRLTLSRNGRRSLARALRRRHRARVTILVTASDRSGNFRSAKRRLTLRR